MKGKRYYSLYQEAKTANIFIYGDITSYPWDESDVSSFNLSKQLQELEDVDQINVYINSYGGEVAEGLAIYNSLKRHKASITTIADGFACSVASVIFAAGDERIIYDTSLLMIHNAWNYARGNAKELRKQADDLETINSLAVNAYMKVVNITEEELNVLMDDESWINSVNALEKGFATSISEVEEKNVATQSIRKLLAKQITEGPEKVVVTKTAFSKEEMEKMIQEQLGALSAKLTRENKLEDQRYQKYKDVGKKEEDEKGIKQKEELENEEEKPDIKDEEDTKENEENKPLNMIKALFKLREEENNGK